MTTKTKERLLSLSMSILALILLGLACVYLVYEPTTDQVCDVVRHHWQREVRIENYTPRQYHRISCSDMPPDAYEITDEGTGQRCIQTWFGKRQIEECNPVNLCGYLADRWAYFRSATSSGQADQEPFWPEYTLAEADDHGLGQERVAREISRYLIDVIPQGEDAKPITCQIGFALWTFIERGDDIVLPVGILTRRPNCGAARLAD